MATDLRQFGIRTSKDLREDIARTSLIKALLTFNLFSSSYLKGEPDRELRSKEISDAQGFYGGRERSKQLITSS